MMFSRGDLLTAERFRELERLSKSGVAALSADRACLPHSVMPSMAFGSRFPFRLSGWFNPDTMKATLYANGGTVITLNDATAGEALNHVYVGSDGLPSCKEIELNCEYVDLMDAEPAALSLGSIPALSDERPYWEFTTSISYKKGEKHGFSIMESYTPPPQFVAVETGTLLSTENALLYGLDKSTIYDDSDSYIACVACCRGNADSFYSEGLGYYLSACPVSEIVPFFVGYTNLKARIQPNPHVELSMATLTQGAEG